jgi:hypothetical protein
MATLATHQKVDPPKKKKPTGGETIASNILLQPEAKDTQFQSATHPAEKKPQDFRARINCISAED